MAKVELSLAASIGICSECSLDALSKYGRIHDVSEARDLSVQV
jgi:hypothetical protein